MDQVNAIVTRGLCFTGVYGRPKQSSETSGPAGGPLTVEQLAMKMLEEG